MSTELSKLKNEREQFLDKIGGRPDPYELRKGSRVIEARLWSLDTRIDRMEREARKLN